MTQSSTESPADPAVSLLTDTLTSEMDTDPRKLPDFSDPLLYLNRELAQIEFNSRVMAQAEDARNPLLERLRFMCISCTNLDEFFEVRVAVLKHHHAFGEGQPRADAMSITEILKLIRERTLVLVEKQYSFWNDTLLPELAREGIRFLTRKVWTTKQKRWLQGYFRNETLPVLSPLGLDPAHPFPRILNKSLTLAVVLAGKDAFGREGHMALLRAPRSLPRIIRLPDEVSEGCIAFVFLSDLLHEFMDELFPGMQVKGSYQFRVTRNSELFVDEEEVENLALALRDELRGRGYAKACATARSMSVAASRFTIRSIGPISSFRFSCNVCIRPWPKVKACSPQYASATFCCIIRSSRLSWSANWSSRQASIRASSRSSRPCIAPARIRNWSTT